MSRSIVITVDRGNKSFKNDNYTKKWRKGLTAKNIDRICGMSRLIISMFRTFILIKNCFIATFVLSISIHSSRTISYSDFKQRKQKQYHQREIIYLKESSVDHLK